MDISLPPELEQYVTDKVRAGDYPDPSAVVRTALEVLRDQDAAAPQDIAELREAVAVGLEQSARGQSTPWDPEEIKAGGRRLLAAKRGDAGQAGR